ncbi:phospholipase D family protein [Lysobacter arvi]|uniref:Phospholipase D family protein n=1 Tax=Lysobacter arvi TaxID=3038776 RepID=A0ABU1C9Z2_9GAMM|nr:phospholipase D family protein [Lysobacter arvi]MDR0182011.1 phospholipase D family protein [Lysobacter arvi]
MVMRRPAPWQAARWLLIGGVLVLVGLAVVVLVTYRPALSPSGTSEHVMPLPPDQTEIDREIAPLLAAHPGSTGVVFLTDGVDAFGARAISARRAGRSLDIQYFIWHNDLTGRLLASEVLGAAERGVRVRILLDDMNAYGLDPHLLAMDAHRNIELRVYNPFRHREGVARALELLRRLVRVNHRMHNKAWIADGRVAIVGGRNIGDRYFEAGPQTNFRDLDLLLFGPAAEQAGGLFDLYWSSDAAVPISSLGERAPEALRAVLARVRDDARSANAKAYLDRVAASQLVGNYYRDAIAPHWTSRIEVVADPPLKWNGDHRQWLVGRLAPMISAARAKALVISPYFIPGEDGTARLAELTRRGVYVGVVTNSLAATDVHAVHSGYAKYRPRLLQNGVRLHELRPYAMTRQSPGARREGASLHTKAFVLDDERGFVGSFNVDPRSKDLNTEMGVLFDDPILGMQLRAEYLRLTTPSVSYWVYRNGDGALRWLDGTETPPAVMTREPEVGPWPRAVVRMVGWLPVEPHL